MFLHRFHLDKVATLVAAYYILSSVVAPALPATVTLGNLVQTYDGTPKTPSVVTDPPGLSVGWRFVDPLAGAPQPVTETVFQNAPNTLALSYVSLSFSSHQTWAVGDRVELAGTARNLESVDVVMVTWAKAADYPALAAADPSGWRHPVRLAVYDMDDAGVLTFKGDVEREIFVPWRPLTLPNGQAYPYNGYAFRAHFDFPTGLTLSQKPAFVVSYNTGNSGFEPIGSPGPYNQLNVALDGNALIGSDVNPTGILWVNSATNWVYPKQGTGPPMFTVKANRIVEPGTSEPPVHAGTWQATAKVNDPIYAGEATANFTIVPATATVTLGDLAATYDGSPKAISVVTNPPGLSVSVTYDGLPTPPSSANSYAVVATVDDANYAGSASGTLVIGKATATVTLGGLAATYDGSPKPVSIVTNPPGLSVSVTYDGLPTPPSSANSYAVVATVDDANYAGSASGTLVIGKATATVTLGGLAATYDGSPKPVSIVTNPPGLSVSVTYDGLPTPPSSANSYAVVATVDDANYAGSASGTLVIGKASATVTLGDLAATYDGSPKPVSTVTNPPGLSVSVTYDGSPTPPSSANSYAVVATVDDANYAGSASGTLVIGKASATVTLGDLAATYDGSPKPVSVVTNPPGLSVSVTYDGLPNPPSSANSYAVVATVDDANYAGSAGGTLVIGKATATVTLGDLTAIYDGGPKTVSISTQPSGLAVDVTYNGSHTLPVAVGRYSVHAVVTDPNYLGSATGELWVGHNLESWLAPWVQAGSIAPTAVGWNDDPDLDRIGNLLEYAFGLDPASGSHGLPGRGMPRVEFASGVMSIIYRKNLAATDLVFQIESAAGLNGSSAWSPATTVNTVIATENSVQTIRATLVPGGGGAHRFMRVKVERP